MSKYPLGTKIRWVSVICGVKTVITGSVTSNTIKRTGVFSARGKCPKGIVYNDVLYDSDKTIIRL